MLVESALLLAQFEVELESGWLHHSDRGSPYTSASYRRLVSRLGGMMSFSDPASPRQNAFVESFIKTVKDDETRAKRYQSLRDLESSLERYFYIYNHERHHSSLGMMAPTSYKNLLRKQQNDQP